MEEAMSSALAKDGSGASSPPPDGRVKAILSKRFLLRQVRLVDGIQPLRIVHHSQRRNLLEVPPSQWTPTCGCWSTLQTVDCLVKRSEAMTKIPRTAITKRHQPESCQFLDGQGVGIFLPQLFRAAHIGWSRLLNGFRKETTSLDVVQKGPKPQHMTPM